MRFNQIVQDGSGDEEQEYARTHDMKKPLPVTTDPKIFDMMEFADDHLANEFRELPYVARFSAGAKLMTVPMNQIVCIEPRLKSSHIKDIRAGNNTQQSSEYPKFYWFDGKYFANDGTHRIVAAFLDNRTAIRGEVVNANFPEDD